MVGGLEHELQFFHILGISSSQLTVTPSFFRGVGQPPTIIMHLIFQGFNHKTLCFGGFIGYGGGKLSPKLMWSRFSQCCPNSGMKSVKKRRVGKTKLS